MRLTEEELRKLTLMAIAELGENAAPEQVKKVVAAAVSKYQASDTARDLGPVASGRIILTSFGINKPGVVARITKSLSEFGCDIQDITQKILDRFFTLIMIVDITNSPKDLRDIQEEMGKISDELKIKIYLQHEDIFSAMHRL